MNPEISDETLHAFVDGELDAAESERLIARMRDDAALSRRVGTLRSLKTMLHVAYADPPVAAARGTRVARPWARHATAAVLLLAGLGGGWVLRGFEQPAAVATAPSPAVEGLSLVRLQAEADPSRVLLHLDNAAPARMQAVLDQAERLLDEAAREGQAIELEIVANSRGLDLLRGDVSPHAARIARLRARHHNLQLVACGQTIARFRKEGEKVELLPAVRTAPTALGEIVERLQQGWTYVRV
jgi:intracellular sulfur oxidation DsrE/DsrF family protein